ncbi:lambda-crystallin-like [Liolophura sinensis]|uniref:lambda-crystallin-like n=1 Tax=Liolophura sinensis TaxID=3198878 RepID=UPI003158E935
MAANPAKDKKIGIVGSGLIGRSWCMLFASVGYQVSVYDSDPRQVSSALADIQQQLQELSASGLLRGSLTAEEQCQRVSAAKDMEDCVQGAKFVQECVPEVLDIKKEIFAKLDDLAGDNTILSSSTSSMVPSLFTRGIKKRAHAIVCHPTNPPYYCPLVEVVPSPWTDPEVLEQTVALMREIGQSPVIIKKEIDGFALNRIQYAIMGECWRLINDGVISVEDMDKVMSDGLGMRYAFLGPLETAYLNADGFHVYAERYGEMFLRIQKSFGEPIPMSGSSLDRIHNELNKVTPVENISSRRQWRDRRLAALAKLKSDMDTKDSK